MFLSRSWQYILKDASSSSINAAGSRYPLSSFRMIPAHALDLLINYLPTAISRFRLRLRKNYSTYTPYMLHNFSFVSLEIWKSRDGNNWSVGLLIFCWIWRKKSGAPQWIIPWSASDCSFLQKTIEAVWYSRFHTRVPASIYISLSGWECVSFALTAV